MPDWTKSMQQTFEYYLVDPGTWRNTKQIRTVKSSSIDRDLDYDTLGSASIDVDETLGECYIREYLTTIQNGLKEKHVLGTHLIQTPSISFDGKVIGTSLDAYTPMLELKETQPPLGYTILKGENIMDITYRLTREHMRAPVSKANCDVTLFEDFVADPNDTWLSFLTDLIAKAKYIFSLDEMGRVLFAPQQDMASLQPVFTFDDSNSSILYPELSMQQDLYGLPNVVEVIYSNNHNNMYKRVVNDDPNSPVSTVNRGREIVHRITNPNLVGNPTDAQVQEYAEQSLRELSSLEYTISYTHGYCPVRLGDCVRINSKRANIVDVKAKVISQTIKCVPGCPVTEKAVFTRKFWGDNL